MVREYKIVGWTMLYLLEKWGINVGNVQKFVFPKEFCVTGHMAFESRRTFLVLFSFHSSLFHDNVSSYNADSRFYSGERGKPKKKRDCECSLYTIQDSKHS